MALRPTPGGRGTTAPAARAGSGSPGSRGSGGGSSGRGSPDGLLRADSASSADQDWEPGSYGLVDVPQPKHRWGRPAAARPATSAMPALAAASGGAATGRSGRAVPVSSTSGGGSCSSGARILARRAASVSSPFKSSARRSLDSPTGPTSPAPSGGSFSFASPVAAAPTTGPPVTLGLGGPWLPGSPRVRSQREAAALLRLDSPAADRDSLGPDERTDSAAFGSEFNAPI
ncbi:hypothetical protein ABPG75_006795 [Micractinium tetrahymenae]